MLKFSYVILLALAVPLSSHAEPAPTASAPAEATSTEAPPAEAPAVEAPKVETPRGAAPRAANRRGKAPRAPAPQAEAAHADAAHAEAPKSGAIAKLKSFIANTRSAQASFTQELVDKNGKRLQTSSGIMQFTRPGKFRWTYEKPYEQVIVGDGVKFWLYDVDLNQVTVKKLDAALGSSPAALLAGSNEIEKSFTLQDAGCEPRAGAKVPQAASQVPGDYAEACAKGLEWLEARPNAPDATFESIRMAFDARSELVIMELRDTFGHTTVLRFSDMMINPKFPQELFKFEPPKGADVLGDE